MPRARFSLCSAGGAVLSLALAVTGVSCDNPADAADPTRGPAADSAAAVAVRVATVTRADLRARVVAYGTVEPEPATPQTPAAAARVGAMVSGVISGVSCAEGQRVKKGTLLFQLDARAAEQAIRQAREVLDFADKELERQEQMQPGEGTSIHLYQAALRDRDTARTTPALRKTQRSYLDITSPLDGTIVQVLARRGETIDPGVPLAEVIDLDRLVAIVRVPERERGALHLGQPVELAGSTGGAQGGSPDMRSTIAGELRFVGSQIDPRDGTVPAWVSFPVLAALLPGQFVEVHIVTEERPGRLAVPRVAVIPDANGRDTVVVIDGGVARHVPVTTGLLDGDRLEVDGDGLDPGTRVVTSGGYGLADGDVVNILGRPPTAAKTPAP
ncbi:MAG: efflux RND transporter periplasmic adaptor subunit [Acidobacteriota bacterium]